MSGSTPCENCHAGCCRAFVVPLSGTDVLRLEQTGLQFWDFAVRWADPDGQIAHRYAPHLFFEDTGDEPFVLGLMHEQSGVHPGTTRCRYLLESTPTAEAPLGRAACSLYDKRPAACRAFPMRMDASRELVQLEPLHAMGRPSDPQPAYRLCPRSWQPHEVDVVETPGQLAAADAEMQFFHKVAALWNRNRGPWEAFPTFLHLVYAGRVVQGETARPNSNEPASGVADESSTDMAERPISVPFPRVSDPKPTATPLPPHRRAA